MDKIDLKAELSKVVVIVLKGLTSRTFWGIAIISYLYVHGVINTEKYQYLAIVITGGTQLPKIAEILTAFMKPAVVVPEKKEEIPTEVK